MTTIKSIKLRGKWTLKINIFFVFLRKILVGCTQKFQNIFNNSYCLFYGADRCRISSAISIKYQSEDLSLLPKCHTLFKEIKISYSSSCIVDELGSYIWCCPRVYTTNLHKIHATSHFEISQKHLLNFSPSALKPVYHNPLIPSMIILVSWMHPCYTDCLPPRRLGVFNSLSTLTLFRR